MAWLCLVLILQVCCVYLFQKQVEANICLSMELIRDALDRLRGATMIVYPMGLPPHEPIRMEFEGNIEDATSGKQVRNWQHTSLGHVLGQAPLVRAAPPPFHFCPVSKLFYMYSV